MVKTKKIQIKDLTAGMKIKTKNEHGEIVFKTVTNKWDTTVNQHDQVRLEFENGVTLNCSVNHPIMVLHESGSFLQKKPKDLTNEDRVLTENGFTRLLIADFEQQNDPGYIDITVDDTHTFFASNSSDGPMVLTHNSQGGIRNACVHIDSYVDKLTGFEFNGKNYYQGDIIKKDDKVINITDVLTILAYMGSDDERDAYLQNLLG